MFKCGHARLVFLSGLVWFIIGCFLLQLGLNLLANASPMDSRYPMVGFFASSEEAGRGVAAAFIAIGLFIGYFKGRYVLAKSVRKGVERILAMSTPTSIAKIYSRPYYLLIALMMGLGFLMRLFGVPSDARGIVDVAVGAALINGSLLYFRSAYVIAQGKTR